MMPPMPAPQDQPMMPCPHCKGPLNLSKGPMPAAPAPDAAPAPAPKADKKAPAKPAKKKNAANMPMDELKEVIKGQGKPHDDGY